MGAFYYGVFSIMSRQIQIRRGTKNQHASFTGAIGEVTMDTTNNTLRVHDGKTVGGNEMLSRDSFYSYMTNCITEVPQNIVLELDDTGLLTLQAGSVIFAPNGANMFKKITSTANASGMRRNDGKCFVFYTGGTLEIFPINLTYSGKSAPDGSQWMYWYDTNVNKIKKTNDNGATWTDTVIGFPLGTVTVSGGQISSIEHVFNGFGYIGSTVFVLPGVRGLIPNGRNKDGTLNNITAQITSVQTLDIASVSDGVRCIAFGNNCIENWSGYLIIKRRADFRKQSWIRQYCIETNEILVWTGTEIFQAQMLFVGFFTTTSANHIRITGIQLGTTFRNVDFNDSVYLVNQSFPGQRTSVLNAISNTVYVAPATGYFCINAIATANTGYISIGDDIMGTSAFASYTGQKIMLFLPVVQNTSITISFNDVSIVKFCFRYAVGAE